MTGSDPQFLARGPFARGLWEWTVRAGVRAETPAPEARIYFGRDGGFNGSATVGFPAFPADATTRTLRFWLPFEADALRFDPADAPGTLVLGEVTARRRGRLAATVAAFARQARRHGPGGVLAWIRELVAAARRGGTALRARMVELITAEDVDNAAWTAATVSGRAATFPARPERDLLSIISTVYDTPPAYLRELAASVRAQTWPDYEWVLLDNGSRSEETRHTLSAIAADPRVKLLRVEPNLGIIGGMRHVLEQATGRYVLPVDSDDLLFPDALAIVAAVLQRERYPPLAYSDEDKLRDGRHLDPYFKPDWDPVLFRNLCYIAHLCAIDRGRALQLGAYSDAAAEGCHDWDTFFRFTRAGATPVHIPALLYSWRMHGGSTAANVDAKDYVLNSQRHVLEQHLAETGLRDRFEVVRSPFFPVSPDWWIRRRRDAPPPIALVLHGDGDIDTRHPAARVSRAAIGEPLVRAWQRAAGGVTAVVAFDTGLVPTTDEWLWEMIGLRESFADAAVVGGRLLDANRLVVGNGRSADDPGSFGTALKQRSVEQIDLRLALLDAEWLCALDAADFDGLPLDALTAALAQRARRDGRRVIFSPFVEAELR